MHRCGIYCNFSEEFYKKFKRNKLHYYRFKEDLIRITSELIYSGNVIFSVGGASEFYRDFMEEFFPACSIIGRVYLEVINDKDYVDYLFRRCDYIYVFWQDDESWDMIAEMFDKAEKDYDIYEMDSVTDHYRNTDKYLKLIAEDDREALINKKDIDFLKRFNINYSLKKRN